jgi:hypothetical protein
MKGELFKMRIFETVNKNTLPDPAVTESMCVGYEFLDEEGMYPLAAARAHELQQDGVAIHRLYSTSSESLELHTDDFFCENALYGVRAEDWERYVNGLLNA